MVHIIDSNNVWRSICENTVQLAVEKHLQLSGNFSCLLATIKLRRQIGYHFVQTYIPTMLIVVISWISFFIDPNAIPARISLSFTTLLTLSTMAAGVRVALPPVAYAKAIGALVITQCLTYLMEFLEPAYDQDVSVSQLPETQWNIALVIISLLTDILSIVF